MVRKIIHSVLWWYRHRTGKLAVPEITVLSRFIPEGSVCVDIGAHAGSWSLPLARLTGHGRVHAIEALPYYADVLKWLFRWRRVGNILLRNVAVTASRCRVPMVWKDVAGNRITGLTHIAGKGEVVPGTVEVEGIPLDELLREETGRVDFMKVDVEGAEMGVFTGGAGIIGRDRPVVFTELAAGLLKRYGNSVEEVFTFFFGQNYRAFVIEEGGRFRTIPDAVAYDRNDVLFVPAEKCGLIT